ncbi:hypothetical protein [Streptomyces sp. NPDC048106]|uniref:hypothetical protein n=1 Tax=Streptomyces sp. NPDC048106 TaxID=3155750 RepID=UPI0034514E39
MTDPQVGDLPSNGMDSGWGELVGVEVEAAGQRLPARVSVSDRVLAARRAGCAAWNPKVTFEVTHVP